MVVAPVVDQAASTSTVSEFTTATTLTGVPVGSSAPDRHRLVLDGAVLQHQVDLAGAGLRGGDAQVDGAGAAERALDAGRAVVLQLRDHLHHHATA